MALRHVSIRAAQFSALIFALVLGCWAQALGGQALLDPATLPAHARLDLGALQKAYPGEVLGIAARPANGDGGGLDLVLQGGARVPYDDGRERDHKQALEDPDVRTMLAQVYPIGPIGPGTEAIAHPAPHFDPGRSRVQALFTRLYGASESQVRAACVGVRFDNRTVLFNARQGAATALGRVGERLARLQPGHPEFAQVLRPLGGTLAWRNIAATGRLSVHSFGAAIDLNPRLPYWLWEKRPERIPALVASFPREIVEAFEAEGFIWGGKWASFDVMHFEYRPELILKARALAGQITLP